MSAAGADMRPDSRSQVGVCSSLRESGRGRPWHEGYVIRTYDSTVHCHTVNPLVLCGRSRRRARMRACSPDAGSKS